MVDRVSSPFFSQPSDSNRQSHFLSEGVDTVLDSSLSTRPQQSRTILSPNLFVAIKNQHQLSVSSISSIMSGTTNTGPCRGYFVRNTARTESEVLAKQVVVPKYKHGIPRSREHGIHNLSATGALDQTFGVASNCFPTSW